MWNDKCIWQQTSCLNRTSLSPYTKSTGVEYCGLHFPPPHKQ